MDQFAVVVAVSYPLWYAINKTLGWCLAQIEQHDQPAPKTQQRVEIRFD